MTKTMSKEEKDQYILDMIKQLKQEQTEFNTEKWGTCTIIMKCGDLH